MDSLNGRTALHWSVASGHFSITCLLIEAGALVNAIDRDSISPLILACNSGDLAIARTLIYSGAKLSHADRMNSTALHYACQRSHPEVARELIAHGCVSNTNTPFSFQSPLKYLVLDRHYAVAKCLIEAGSELEFERWINDEAFCAQHQIEAEFVAWLRCYLRRPRTLMSLCRMRIRAHLGSQYLARKVDSLLIPKFLKQFLLMQF